MVNGGGIIGSLIMANPTVAQLLTDSFIATHYAFAMLLSTGAVWILVQNVTGLPSRRRCLLSIVIITISLGIYQAYFAVTAFLLVSVLIMDLLSGSASLDVVKKGFTYLLVLAGGMILYLIVTQLIFLFLNIEWAQYRDMGDLGHIGLGRWLGRVKDSLGFFWQAYFTGYIFNVTWWKWKGLFALIFAFFGIVLLHWSWGRIKSGRYLDVLLMGGLLICLFLGYGSIHLMTETGTGPLLTPQLMLPFVLIGCVFLRYDLSFDARKLLKKSMLGLSVILLYQMVLYDGAYYKVLKLTYDKTLTVGNKIMDGLSELEGYSQKETPVLILGNAIKENDFLDSEKAIWEAMRGSHTQYTIIHYVNAVGGQACWQFLLAHHLGFTIRTAPAETAYMIVNSEEFKAMPSDQNGEFIQMFENPNGDGTQVAVVKLGDLTYFE